MRTVFAGVTTAIALLSLVQALIGWRLVTLFAALTARPAGGRLDRPSVTVLKPLHGNEPLLEAALATLCTQTYPDWQIVFGVQDPADPAIQVVERLRARFPRRDMTLVVDPTLHGPNRKISNLINMFPAARHDVLVIADSDVHVRPDYLDRLVEALSQPSIGLVTTLYVGRPALSNLVARLGAAQINYGFLPGALLARAIGRQDCLGATMCLRRADLARIGGLPSLVDHLADDNVLGRRVRGLGLGVALAHTVPLTTVPEIHVRALYRHELRWARTIRMLEPAGFAASILQYSLFWALLTVLSTAGSLWSIGLFGIVWLLRAVIAVAIDNALAPAWINGSMPDRQDIDNVRALAFSCPVWLLPLRDVLSVAVMVASYGGRGVDWRGHGLQADTPPPSDTRPQPSTSAARLRPIERTNAS